MNQNLLRERTKRFIDELKLPISRLSKSIGFERTSYYKWVRGDFDFGEARAKALDEYIRRFGF